MTRSLFLVAVLWALVGIPSGTAQDAPVAFVGATVHPVSGPVIQNGTVVVHEGRITYVGGAQGAPLNGARQIDATGKVIMPGIVDTHSHVGQGDGGDSSNPIQPDVRILDTLDPRADSFNKARSGGITTVNVMPGSGHLMSGQTAYLKLRQANTIEEMLVCDDPMTDVCGGMKMANGTNSMRGSGGFPGTRARSAALQREIFYEARAYQKKLADGDTTRNLRMEPLVEILDGRRIVHWHTHRHDDILTALRIAREFGFTPVLHHVSEGWRVADEIAAAGAPASIIALDSPGGKLEARGLIFRTGAALEAAGVRTAYHTDDPIVDSRFFLREAALGVRAGMSREAAIESLTLAGAEMLGLADRVGSLGVGKDADLLVLTGDPLSIYTHVEQTWVDGEKVFDYNDAEDRPYAEGGFDVYRNSVTHVHD
ncbi:MAG: amidohydrolase family protein [Rubricoccaceae bacterium]